MSEALKPGYLTVREAVDLLCAKGMVTSVNTFRTWLYDRGVPRERVGNVIVFRKEELEKYMPRGVKAFV